MLQYFEDDMVAWERGPLQWKNPPNPVPLILYIMEHVNPGLPEGFWVEWLSIVGSSPWLISPEPHESGRTGPFLQ